jgi:AhpC/TSA family
VWQQLHEELSPFGLTIIAVAIDADEPAVREWATKEAFTMPMAIDRNFVVADAYGIINVPATVWIDEDGRIVRPPSAAMGDDRFQAFTNVDSSVHHNMLRAWVRDGVRPLDDTEVRNLQPTPTDEIQLARLHRQIAIALRDRGDDVGAVHHLDAAEALAPWDWTITRGNMPLRGDDPFGARFFEFIANYAAAGRPGDYPLQTGKMDS